MLEPIPKMVFSLGYFPVQSGEFSLLMFQVHHQDERTINNGAFRFPCVLRSSNGWRVISDSSPSLDLIMGNTLLIQGLRPGVRSGMVYRCTGTSVCARICGEIVEALSDWAENHPAFELTLPRKEENDEEGAAPPVFEPGELQKFILP